MPGWLLLMLAAACLAICLAACAWLAVLPRRRRRRHWQAPYMRSWRTWQVAAQHCGLQRRPAVWLALGLVGLPPLVSLCLFPVKLVPLGCSLLVSVLAPPLALRLLRRRRLRAFEAQLPDALRLIAAAVSAGASISSALERAAAELPFPIAPTLERAVEELRLGAGLDVALRRLERELPISEMSLAATSISVAHHTGADLPRMLKRVAASVEERLRIKGKLKALTAQGVFSGWVVGLAPLFLLGVLHLMEPSYTAPLFNTNTGLAVLAFCLLLELLGLLTIRRIVNIRT